MSNEKKKMSPIIIVIIVVVSIPVILFICGIIAAIAIPHIVKAEEEAENNSSYETYNEELLDEDIPSIAQAAVYDINKHYELYLRYPIRIEEIETFNKYSNLKISSSSTEYAPFISPELANGFYYYHSVNGDTFQLVIYNSEGERIDDFSNVDYIPY